MNVSGDGRFIVAAFSDGTIRWHRLDDGRELLALYPHADGKQWVAWTPEGYFDASPGAEDLVGYHLKRGGDREGDFVDARQLWETFYQPGLVAAGSTPTATSCCASRSGRGDVRSLLTAGKVPELVPESSAIAKDGTYEVVVRVCATAMAAASWCARGRRRRDRRALDHPRAHAGQRGPHAGGPGRRAAQGLGRTGGRARRGLSGRNGGRDREAPGERGRGTLHVLAVGWRTSSVTPKLKPAAETPGRWPAAAREGGPRFEGRVVTRTLTDDEDAVARIGSTLAEMAAKARPEDTFVLFMAGHGTMVGEQYYFLPWELDNSEDAAVRKQALSQQQLRDWIASCR